MIDINEVLRRAVEAGKMPPEPKVGRYVNDHRIQPPPIDLRQRPDGVWCLPE